MAAPQTATQHTLIEPPQLGSAVIKIETLTRVGVIEGEHIHVE